MSESKRASDFHFHCHTLSGVKPGPRLIVLGAVHGNETCGTKAIERVLCDIEESRLNITSGMVTFVPITNPLAYHRHQRTGDRNLNRNLYPVENPKDFEDHVANWLCPLLAEHDVLLDLHSTRAQNPAFAMLGPEDNSGNLQAFKHQDEERALALRHDESRAAFDVRWEVRRMRPKPSARRRVGSFDVRAVSSTG